MKGCMPSTVKYLLFAVNLLTLLMGLIVLGFSIYGIVDGRGLSKLVEEGAAAVGEDITVDLYSSASVLLTIFSSLVVVISFLGCCGALKENRFLIFLYFTCLLIVFLGSAIGATITVFQNLDVLKNPLLNSMSKYDPNSDDPEILDINQAWDDIQNEFTCCGVNSYEDWPNVTNVYPDDKKHLVPASCCSGFEDEKLEKCRTTPGDDLFASHMKGCLKELQSSVADNKYTITIASSAIIAFLFVNLLVLFGFGLCLAPTSGYEQV